MYRNNDFCTMRAFSKPGFCLFFLIAFFQAQAQVSIKGLVRDNKNRPIAGASLGIKASYDGATSDSLGRFSFRTSEKGEQILTATSIGYKPYEQKIRLDGEALNLDILLKEEITELNAVVLTAGTFEASDRKRAAVVLDPLDIVTTASANGDITGALKTLPGAQQVGESEGLYVRGGTAAETKTFIDGTLVNNFFYSSVPNIAQFSRFSPFLFKGTVFSTGGYSALYGQALSSALILESIDLPERTTASVGITVLSANAGYQHLAKDKNSSWGANYSYTHLGPVFEIIKQKQDYSQAPVYHTADANFRVKTSNTGIFKYYGYFNKSDLAFTSPSIDSLGYLDRFGIGNHNFYHNISWKENMGRKWKILAGLSFTNNKDEISSGLQDPSKMDVLLVGLEQKKFEVQADGNYFNAKLVLERKLKGLSAFRFGAEYNYSHDKTLFSSYNGQQFRDKIKEHIKSLFAEVDIYITRL